MMPRLLAITLVMTASVASLALAEDEPQASARPEAIEDGWLERRWATTDLTALAVALEAWRAEHGDWPADCPGAAAALIRPAPQADPWGTPYSCIREDPPRVVSAGPDRSFGTADDLAYRLDGKGIVAATDGAPAAVAAPTTPLPAPPATDEAKATTDRLVWLARALEAYSRREKHYPVAEKAEYLENWLVPGDLPPSQWFAEDAWGRPWRYRVTDTGSSYSLSSGGADGRWEPLTPPSPQPAPNADGDLVVADGRFVRWPSGFEPEPLVGARRAAEARPAPKEPSDPLEATRWRLDRLAAVLDRARADGRFVESDDAQRTFEELGSGLRTIDAWGRPIELQTIASGTHYALVSRGADGRQSRSTEDHARGAAPSGDDVILRR